MTTKLFALIFTIVLLLIQPSFLLGQRVSEQPGWETVQALSAGTKLSVETKDGKIKKGKLDNVSSTVITLTAKGGKTVSFNRDEIRKIYRLEKGLKAKSTLIGTGIGAGVGAGAALILLASTGGSDDFSGIVATGLLIGAGVGAALGSIAGLGSRKFPVYESK